jgi:hypothetical protein
MSTDERPLPDEEPVETAEAAPGDPRVDAALRRAGELAATSPGEHVEIYEDVHRSLQEVLADAAGQSGQSGEPDASASTEPPAESAESGDAVR